MELPTISFEEALKKEEEYKSRLRLAHPWALGPNLHQAPIKETTSHDRRPSFYANGESSVQRPPLQFQPHASPNYRPPVALQQAPYPNQQQRFRPPMKPRQQKLPPYVQISRPAQLMSYWCKLCKIDCTTEQNFRAHIGGKRHEAKKLTILEGKNNTRGDSSGNRNGRSTNQSRNQSLNENRAAEPDIIRQEGEGSGLASAREVEPSVKSDEPSNCSDGLIDLTTDE